MSINVYMNFNGNTRDAVEFYSEIFNTEKPQIMTFGEAPQHPDYPLAEEAKNLVMHARLTISGSTVMFSDTMPGRPYVEGNNITLTYGSQNEEELKSVFNKLSDNGKVTMELQETFWSKLYGQLTDKFGIHWQINFDNGDTGM
ncbi:VOC family protein [Peribacillus sp. B-H-3]|uniref:VOC family protein n=1 Tax=Peribacillus sp. B-H-3 TaxID=3400420 RepID=UPI003B029DCB